MSSEQNKEQKTAEVEVESFRKNLGPFVVAAETTRMAMVFTDAAKANHPFVFANESFLSLTGYDRKEVLGHGQKRRARGEKATEILIDGGICLTSALSYAPT